jgi:hypothetical protein
LIEESGKLHRGSTSADDFIVDGGKARNARGRAPLHQVVSRSQTIIYSVSIEGGRDDNFIYMHQVLETGKRYDGFQVAGVSLLNDCGLRHPN